MIQVARTKNESTWIPRRDGIWTELDADTIVSVLRAAAPYSLSPIEGNVAGGRDDGLDVGTSSTVQMSQKLPQPESILVKREDVTDILFVAGLECSASETEQSLARFAHLLSGLIHGELCFQEILTIFFDVKKGDEYGPSDADSARISCKDESDVKTMREEVTKPVTTSTTLGQSQHRPLGNKKFATMPVDAEGAKYMDSNYYISSNLL